jgi:hypothetical protein
VTEPLFTPETVPPAAAATVLAFLNAATTPEEVATGIELPEELDIGLRMGRRLLDRRAQLGGFRTLAQVAEVPLVGPIRFDQIVRALTGLRASPPVDELLEEIRRLQAMVASLQGGRVELAAPLPGLYLGRPAVVRARVTDAGGAPRLDAAVTLTTSWGRLRGSDGRAIADGTAVTLLSAADGWVEARLVPPVSEEILGTPQQALEIALGRLPAGAATPAEAVRELEQLVREYRREANADLRRAIDVYFRDFAQHRLGRVTARDDLLAWSHVDAAVHAFAHEDTAVAATAVTVVRFRDWLAPWLQVHEEAVSGDSTLGLDLRLATNDPDDRGVIDRVNREVGRFTEIERGVVGQAVAHRLAGQALETFLSHDLDTVPLERRGRIFRAVEATATTIERADAAMLAATETKSADLRGELATKADKGALADALDGLVDRATFDAALNTKIDRQTLDEALKTKVDQTRFDEVLRDKIDRPTLDEALRTKVDEARFEEGLRGKVDEARFEEGLRGKVDTQVLNRKFASIRNLDDLRSGIELRP